MFLQVIDMNDTLKEILSLSIEFLLLLLFALFIITFIGQRTVVDGSSMETTLFDKDNIIVEKISYRFNNPERFDVVVFPYKTEKHTYLIKRVIGLPGESVRIDEDGNIYINDVILEENYGKERINKPGLAAETITLGPDEYFVLGDNRNNSVDSRYSSVGNVKKKDISGRAWLRIYPFKKIGFVENLRK